MYHLDYSDDDSHGQLPSTPDRQRRSTRFASPTVSTTPAGPPPTSFTGQSTTPAGPPPASSLFGSSRLAPPPTFSTNGSFTRNVPSSPPPLVQSAAIREDADYDFESDPDAMDEEIQGDDPFLAYAVDATGTHLEHSSDAYDVAEVAKSLALRDASLDHTSYLVTDTERIMDGLYHTVANGGLDLLEKDLAISEAANKLVHLWDKPATFPSKSSVRIGPGAAADSTAKAGFVTSLLLALHHEPTEKVQMGVRAKKSIPQVLIEWLNTHHWPSQAEFNEIFDCKPNATAHPRFWDATLSAALHCDFETVLEMFRRADWSYAATSEDDGSKELGYHGRQLTNVQRVARRFVQVVEASPAIQHGDYDIANADWSIWRKRVENADLDLQAFSEGDSADRFSPQESRRAAAQDLSLSQQSRRAESKVPWTVYQSLRYIYCQFMGSPAECSAASQDWLEACIGKTIWWDGIDDTAADTQGLRHSIAGGRKLLTASASHNLIDIDPRAAYLAHLKEAMTPHLGNPETDDEAELQLNTNDPVEVALACALTGDVDGVLSLLNGWSIPISTSVLELAELGKWLGAPSAELMQGFDQSDLMVLSYGAQHSQGNKRDLALRKYADLLAAQPSFAVRSSEAGTAGWQLAVQVLGRSRDRTGSIGRIKELLTSVQAKDPLEVDETTAICRRLGLVDEANVISCQYADHLVNSAGSYGEAIFHYVRGQAGQRVRDLLDVLTTLSLVQSTAFPPTAQIDASLHELVTTPQRAVARLRRVDPAAADEVMSHVSGYASLRKFFDARDARTTSSLLARRKAAAPSLVALIQSASDGIHGGLFDNTVFTSVPVDVLLVLLGEALALLGRAQRIFTTHQLFVILKAVEDLSTVSSGVRARAEETFKATVRARHGSPPSSPRTALRREPSGMTGSAFSLIGNSDVLDGGATAAQPQSTGASAVLVPRKFPKRMWDWRQGLERDTSGADVLVILRLQIAKELGTAWMAQHAA